MGQHRSTAPAHDAGRKRPWALVAGAVAVLAAFVLAVLPALHHRDAVAGTRARQRAACNTPLRVVTSTSFAPVVDAVAGAAGGGCRRPQVSVVDGRAAAERAAQADVWIPDDASWLGTAPAGRFAAKGTAGAGTVLASSPIYMVTDRATAGAIDRADGSWLALAKLVANGSGVRLVVRDPSSSGDGMVAIGSVGEAVWLATGMDASALTLAKVLHASRTVPGAAPALPNAPGEVGLVPEYALLPRLGQLDPGSVLLGGRDHTATLRFTWLPTVDAARDPVRSLALNRLLAELTGRAAGPALRTAGLRQPESGTPADPGANRLPPLTAKPFDVLEAHHVDHVFSTWYATDRTMDLLLVTDVSGSMARPAPGTRTPLIDLVRQGCREVARLLPDTARLGLWEFGAQLDPPRDYRNLVPAQPLDAAQRDAFAGATAGLAARPVGTGLFDTILAAYVSARDNYQPGMPNQVVIFTDGRNEDDPNSISAVQLTGQLAAARDAKRPVQLTLLTFGAPPDAGTLDGALKPIGGSVHPLQTADEVEAVFIHVTAGGLHAP